MCIRDSTKGGRDRTVPIDSEKKRELLDRAKIFAGRPTASTAAPELSLKQALGHYSRALRNAGITKATAGVTSHGLRHNYANDRYQHYAHADSPVRGGSFAQINRELDRAARLEVSEELGHSRESVSTYYLGR